MWTDEQILEAFPGLADPEFEPAMALIKLGMEKAEALGYKDTEFDFLEGEQDWLEGEGVMLCFWDTAPDGAPPDGAQRTCQLSPWVRLTDFSTVVRQEFEANQSESWGTILYDRSGRERHLQIRATLA